MNASAAVANCPYPGCALEEEHSGDHVPRVRLVQRYLKWEPLGCTMHPGFCEIGECRGTAVALYATFDGKSVQTCEACEADLIEYGWTKLGNGEAA